MERREDKRRQGDGETLRFKFIVSVSHCLLASLSLCLAALSIAGCGNGLSSSTSNSSSITVPAARPVPADAAGGDGSQRTILYLEDRVKRDPDDFIALNKLAGYYLSRL